MKRILVLVLAGSFLLGACASSTGIEVRGAWARPAAQGENGAIYFVIRNHGPEADELREVSSEAAEAIEIHGTAMEGDVMQMHQLQSVALEPGSAVTFEPGGLHIMLIQVKQGLRIGDELPITLHFRSFGDINLLVPIRESPAAE